MSIVLTGGGAAQAPDGLGGAGIESALQRFVADARVRCLQSGDASAARITVVTVGRGSEPQRQADAWRRRLERIEAGSGPRSEDTLPLEIRVVVRESKLDGSIDGDIDASELLGIDGLVIGDGTPTAYLRALDERAIDVRRLVSEGIAYLGHGAGAQIAATRVIAGGVEIGGVPVCPEAAERTELRDVAIEAGLGLVDLSIDVRAAGAGTLGRTIASVEADLVEAAIAIDEETAVVVAEGELGLVGTGSIWQIMPGERGISVETVRAA